MKKRILLVFVSAEIILLVCAFGGKKKEFNLASFETNSMENSSELKNAHGATTHELVKAALEIAEKRIFSGCAIGVMRGKISKEYADDASSMLKTGIENMGYTVKFGTDNYDISADVLIIMLTGTREDAVALLTREDVVLVMCCDMQSTEMLLYSDNDYYCIGERMAAVGMNDEECKKIENR